jgi:enamine deaminase RidA (YjgF/YER057c/UK114 family)
VVDPGEALVFAAGGSPWRSTARLVGEGDLAARAEQVLANLAAALRAAGSSLDRVVKATVYVVAAGGADPGPSADRVAAQNSRRRARAVGTSRGPRSSSAARVA